MRLEKVNNEAFLQHFYFFVSHPYLLFSQLTPKAIR